MSQWNGLCLLIDWLRWDSLDYGFWPLHSSNIKQKLHHWEMLSQDHSSFLRSQSNKSLRINFVNSFNLSDTGDSLQYIWGFQATAKWKIRNISIAKEIKKKKKRTVFIVKSLRESEQNILWVPLGKEHAPFSPISSAPRLVPGTKNTLKCSRSSSQMWPGSA